ncbi:AAA family ATPase, partial [uncultured Ornithinimicrobium sp.]|uniref:AAA family ATPase n=1 Tax=uncultured Ornithinimicrobium sp. TaxID=259307 RepID=UPI00259184D6
SLGFSCDPGSLEQSADGTVVLAARLGGGRSVFRRTAANPRWIVRSEYVLPEWALALFRTLERGQHVVLSGCLDDVHLMDGVYRSATEVVEELALGLGFEIVGRYDQADGLQIQPECQEAYSRAAPWRESARPAQNSSTPGTIAETPAQLSGASLRERRLNQVRSVIGSSADPDVRDPDEAVGVMRRLLSSPEIKSLIIVDFADLMLDTPPIESAMRRQLTLRKAMRQGGHWRQDGSLDTNGNVLVLLADNASRLPPWLRSSGPLVTTLQVTAPDMSERRAILAQELPSFYGASALPGEQRANVIESLAALSEGLSGREVRSLSSTSRAVNVSPTEAKQLLSVHRLKAQKNPWEDLDSNRVVQAQRKLEARVLGQPRAVQAVVDMLKTSLSGFEFASPSSRKSSRPRGVFFFVGPTGVGKTELAKGIADLLFDDEGRMLRLDMSEYNQAHSAERLVGSPPGYVGHEAGGVLTNWGFEHPFSVVLFDEVEKAHPSTFDKFLQLIDEGRLSDGRGRTADFSQSILVFTSNHGSQELLTRLQHEHVWPAPTEVEKLFRDAAQKKFSMELGRPELYARFGNGIVPFDLIRPEVASGICRKFLDGLAASALERRKAILQFPDDSVVEMVKMILMRDPRQLELGARAISNPILEEAVRIPLARWWIDNEVADGSTVAITASAKTLEVNFSLL